jgi:hypothetical protein
MATFCKKRAELFAISAFLGGGVSTIAFKYKGDQISTYLDLPPLHGYLILFLILAYLLPPLAFYLSLYLLNRLLIRLFAESDFNAKRRQIVKRLVEARLCGEAADVDPSDLLEEYAWTSVKECWRPE